MEPPESRPPTSRLNVRQAAFIGVGAMVGAGIFSLLGAAGEVAGAAVWLSFLLAGVMAGLQGYSFAKFGARYPSAGGLLEYVVQGFGDGHFTGIIAWLVLATNAIVTGMVAVSFGSYASSAVNLDSEAAVKVFAVLVVARHDAAEHRRLAGGGPGPNPHRLRGARHPHPVRRRHAGEPQPAPARLLRLSAAHATSCRASRSRSSPSSASASSPSPPRTCRTRPGSCRGPCTSHSASQRSSTSPCPSVSSAPSPSTQVIESGGTALAVAAQPVLGQAGYWLMTVTALFATSGATNAGLYPGRGAVRTDGGHRSVPAGSGSSGRRSARHRDCCSPRRSRPYSPPAST